MSEELVCMIEIKKVYKIGNKVDCYECLGGGKTVKKSKDEIVKLLGTKSVSNATLQVYKGTNIIRLKDKTIPVVQVNTSQIGRVAQSSKVSSKNSAKASSRVGNNMKQGTSSKVGKSTATNGKSTVSDNKEKSTVGKEKNIKKKEEEKTDTIGVKLANKTGAANDEVVNFLDMANEAKKKILSMKIYGEEIWVREVKTSGYENVEKNEIGFSLEDKVFDWGSRAESIRKKYDAENVIENDEKYNKFCEQLYDIEKEITEKYGKGLMDSKGRGLIEIHAEAFNNEVSIWIKQNNNERKYPTDRLRMVHKGISDDSYSRVEIIK